MANAGTFHGHDGFVSWITAWTDAWQEISAEVTDTIPVGERHIVTAVHQEGRGRDGIELSMELAFLFEVGDDGLCTSWRCSRHRRRPSGWRRSGRGPRR